ncbi:MAG: ClbS/DfsB family four-helix bundle protein [Dehalococcoidia bacterium]
MTRAPTPAEHKQKLLDELGQTYHGLLADLKGLSEEQLTKAWLGTWSVREILIHVVGWQREMIGAMERIGRGERPTPEGVDYGDTDAWNARFVREAGQRPVSLVLADLGAIYADYRQAAQALPEDRFAPGRSVDRILHASAIDHFWEHATQIREWRRREGL